MGGADLLFFEWTLTQAAIHGAQNAMAVKWTSPSPSAWVAGWFVARFPSALTEAVTDTHSYGNKVVRTITRFDPGECGFKLSSVSSLSPLLPSPGSYC